MFLYQKPIIRISMLFLGSLLFFNSAYSQLLIVKRNQDNTGFIPLDASDNSNKAALSKILLKYEWPTVIATTDLTPEEQDQLLSSCQDSTYAEEDFISKKLQEINPRYHAVFIPTTLYELFIMTQYSEKKPILNSVTIAYQLSFSHWVKVDDLTPEEKELLLSICAKVYNQLEIYAQQEIFATKNRLGFAYNNFQEFKELFKKIKILLNRRESIILLSATVMNNLQLDPRIYAIIKKIYEPCHYMTFDGRINMSTMSPDQIYNYVYDIYAKTNNLFYHDAFFSVNNILAERLLTTYPYIINLSYKKELSTHEQQLLEQETHKCAASFIKEKTGGLFAYENHTLVSKKLKYNELNPENWATINPHGIVAQVIALEYKARKQNKALLMRGTSNIQLDNHSKEIVFCGSTLVGGNALQKIDQYSISFGNSLFAGAQDSCEYKGATVYTYLARCGGYAIMLDKKEHYQHSSHNLFFVAPVAPLAAHFSIGEYFHSRTKVSIDKKTRDTGSEIKSRGLHGKVSTFSPITRLISIIRNPLTHAELFSHFLEKNMHIISDGKLSLQQLELKKQELFDGQKELTCYYKSYSIIKRLFDNYPVDVKKTQQNMREYYTQKRLEKSKLI